MGENSIELDGEMWANPFSKICNDCIYLVDGPNRKCAAYPDGIPDDIWLGKSKHDKVRPDQDNDIVYKKIRE